MKKQMNSFGIVKRVAAAALMCVVTITAMPTTAFAANVSINDIHVSEDNYAETMETVVEPYLESIIETGYITGNKKASLYYEKYVMENAKGTIVISHGFSENLEKYNEMIYYFTNMGYSVYAMEHRGHSRSTHLGIDDSQVHVEDFDYYVTDLKKFLDQVVVPEATKDNLFIFAHSMGGGIATRFLETYTNYFDAAILSAPMHEVNTGTIPAWLAQSLALGVSYTKYADQYVLGQGAYAPTFDLESSGTSSLSRYTYSYTNRVNNKELQMGGASYNWTMEAFAATYQMKCPLNAFKVKIPVMLFQAGNDTYVGNSGQDTFAKYARNCTIVRYDEAKHEIFNECDEIQVDYLNNVFDFLAQQ